MTEVQIANRALDEVGKAPISTMSDTSPNGKLVRRHFDSVIRTIVADPDFWEFDLVLALSPNTSYNSDNNVYDYEYDIPANNGIKNVWDENEDSITKYDLQTNKLYCNINPISIKYVKYNVTAFPEYIGNAMVFALAAAMAKKGEGGTSRTELMNLYKVWDTKARKISKNQRRPRQYAIDEPYSFLEVRGGNRRRSDFPPATFGPS